MYSKYFVIYLCLLSTPSLQAARILSIFGYPGPSQYAFIQPLLKELAGRGHQITSITNYPQTEPLQNFRDIVIEENVHLFEDHLNFSLEDITAHHFQMVEVIYKKASKMCSNICDNSAVRKVFASEEFDLIILEVFFTECLYGLAEYFKAPIVGVSSLGAMTGVDKLVGNISPISYIPNMVIPAKEMNFWQRLLNLVIQSTEWTYYNLIYLPEQKRLYERYFPKAEISFEEAQKNFALVLVNDHFSLSASRPYVPNMIEVAGLHINTNPEPLSKAIKEILDNAEEGVIYVDADSVMSFKVMDIFLKNFEKIEQVVLWKTSLDVISNSSNVYTSHNYSKASILTHPNTRLFISDGGFLSVVESIYYGVPILSLVPTYSARDYVRYIRKIGHNLLLREQNISEETLSKALYELLKTSYHSNLAKVLSQRFRDQLSTPMERAVYWIEYVLRHNGAWHLRNMGQNLTWYQFHNVDVFVFILCIILLLICLAYLVVIVILKIFCKLFVKKAKTD